MRIALDQMAFFSYEQETASMALIDVGSDAPDFYAETGSGVDFRLSDHNGSSRVMLVFYPKDFTSGCTTQLANVQRSLTDMLRANVKPFGISADTAESHQQFCDDYNLEFELLVDDTKAAARAYGALKPDGGILRSVFVVGQDGRIIFAQEGAPSWQDVLKVIGTVADAAQPTA